MTQKRKSKEEIFLGKLLELAKKRGGPEEEVDRYAVGNEVGENTRTVDNMVQVLTKNNFLKKGEDGLIRLTPLGVRLAEEE